MSEPRTLIIGDTHGNYDALAALLIQEGIIDPVDHDRVNYDVRVIHVGDLGDFSARRQREDDLCYSGAVNQGWFNTLLWGNHDRAVISPHSQFKGYEKPLPETLRLMAKLVVDGTLVLATTAHGFLVTHAGLRPEFAQLLSPTSVPHSAKLINRYDREHRDLSPFSRIWCSIGERRGGLPGDVGGILWRDFDEELWNGARQVFGHSISRWGTVRTTGDPERPSYAIDVGAKSRPMQAGIWLPEEKIVRVDERGINDLIHGGR